MPTSGAAPLGRSRSPGRLGILTAFVVLTNVFGNFSLSWGVKQSILSPWVILGVLLLILWTLARMTLLSWADLSFVLPVTAIGYVLVAVMGRVFLHEAVSPGRWAGTLLIVAGAALVGATTPHTTREPAS